MIHSSTYFEHPSVHPQEELYMQCYGVSFMHPYKQSVRCQDVPGYYQAILIYWHYIDTIDILSISKLYRCYQYYTL